MTSDSSLEDGAPRRVAVRISGIVQGVGFRPFVYRLAHDLGLAGFVRNDARGVGAEVEGSGRRVTAFLERVRAELPPLASIEAFSFEELAPTGDAGFSIRESDRHARPTALVTPDTATCDDCLRELFDPADRRYRYPFINCTNCGPRFTIVRGIPYDRPYTTMAAFEMCGPCRAEYEDPLDRRFHAQPNACPACGPRARLVDAGGADTADGADAAGGDAVARAARALRQGRIVAIKGLGGYHLACDAANADAVRELRGRKHREDKPFAIMAPDLEAARGLATLGPLEIRWLTGPERPIVLVPRHADAAVADSVAPASRDLGLMLPYTPLHHLLLADAGVPLVMTSGNVSDEPIAFVDEEARARLARIADLFLVHDRPIHTRTDDSVLRVVEGPGGPSTLMLRRSRGFVPVPVALPVPAARPLLAVGVHLKNTFALVAGARVWVGHHIGDLENYETLRSFEEGIAHFETLFEVRPEVVVHDLHPAYLSTSYAHDRRGVERTGVQHHHAHLAGCLAEHGETGPALGAIYDGTGYGPDGTVWGGELLAGDLTGFERVGRLWPVRLPGGEAAIRQPWRMACAWLCELDGDVPAIPPALEGRVDAARWRAVARLALQGVAAPITTSVGRLFDAIAALCGLHTEVTYEGQAAIALEMAAASESAIRRAAHRAPSDPLPLPSFRDESGLILDARETVRAARDALGRGVPPSAIARRFHAGLAAATATALLEESGRLGLETVVLSGGVFQNRLLLEETVARLVLAARTSGRDLRVLIPERLPPNDGGISYGQAAVAAARGGSD